MIKSKGIFFEVMKAYGVHEKLVSMIERVYSDNVIKFELRNMPHVHTIQFVSS